MVLGAWIGDQYFAYVVRKGKRDRSGVTNLASVLGASSYGVGGRCSVDEVAPYVSLHSYVPASWSTRALIVSMTRSATASPSLASLMVGSALGPG